MSEHPIPHSRPTPRRETLSRWHPAEWAISGAQNMVSNFPDDDRVRRAIKHLEKAQSLVADFIDGVHTIDKEEEE